MNTTFESDFDIMGVDEEDELFLDAQEEIILVPSNIKKSDTSLYILDVDGERNTLPHLRPPNFKIGFWKVLKQLIRKGITKVFMPVYFNEPLSMTQRVIESAEYCD